MTLFLNSGNSGDTSNKRMNSRCQSNSMKRFQFFPTGATDSVQFQSKSMLLCGYQQRASRVDMKRQRTQNSQHNIKEEERQRNDTSLFQDFL